MSLHIVTFHLLFKNIFSINTDFFFIMGNCSVKRSEFLKNRGKRCIKVLLPKEMFSFFNIFF